MKLFKTKLKSIDRSNIVNEFLPEGTKQDDIVVIKNCYGSSGQYRVVSIDTERSIIIDGKEIVIH